MKKINSDLSVAEKETIIRSRDVRYGGDSHGITRGMELNHIILDSEITKEEINCFRSNYYNSKTERKSCGLLIEDEAYEKLLKLASESGRTAPIVLRAMLYYREEEMQYSKPDIFKYFEPDDTAPVPIGEYTGNISNYIRSRSRKAFLQKMIPAVSVSKVISLVNDYLRNFVDEKSIRSVDTIELRENSYAVIDGCIIAAGINWTENNSDIYRAIKKKFRLNDTNDIIWICFTKTGYIGGVYSGAGICFHRESISGKIIKSSAEEWDESLVLIFPVTPQMLNERTTKDYMTGTGNWLIDNHVPVMDYYNHNYHY